MKREKTDILIIGTGAPAALSRSTKRQPPAEYLFY